VAERLLSLGVPTTKVVVVRSGIPVAERTGAVREGERLRLGIVGQIGEWKGHEDLIDALGLLQHNGIGPSLFIFGSGAPDYVATLEKRAVELGVHRQIEWCGYVADESRIYGAIDVCIVPSRCDEALGMSAIEAGGFGCPVICSSRGGLPEIVKHGETGFVVEPEHPEQIAEAIKSFAQNRDLVRTMGAAAQTRVHTQFSTQRFVNEFIQVLEELSA
jgi:glycosyltransferase involved in cell wall biosynthesis